MQQTTVTELLFDRESNSITGVKFRAKGSEDESDLFADLVVDCGGPNSKQTGVYFLKKVGLDIEREHVDTGVGYLSAFYTFDEPPTRNGIPVSIFYIQADPLGGHPIGFAAGQTEGGRYHLGWYGYNRNYPPSNEDELMDFTQKLRDPKPAVEFYSKAKRISPLTPYRDVVTQRVRCEQYPNWPENYILMGDSMANFTPVYAQGMTFAAMSGELLQNVLDYQQPGNIRGLAKAYIKAVTPLLDFCWAVAAGEEFCMPGVKSNTTPPKGFWFMHNYVDYAMKAIRISEDRKLHYLLINLIHMSYPPYYMFHPRILFWVLRMYLNDKLGRKQK